jgi:hypothetical protein
MLTKADATKRGKALKAKVGKGWKLDIWENLGWHYCVVNAPMTIYGCETSPDTYHIMMSDRAQDARSGSIMWSRDGSSSDVRKLVYEQYCLAIQVVTGLQATVSKAGDILEQLTLKHMGAK